MFKGSLRIGEITDLVQWYIVANTKFSKKKYQFIKDLYVHKYNKDPPHKNTILYNYKKYKVLAHQKIDKKIPLIN